MTGALNARHAEALRAIAALEIECGIAEPPDPRRARYLLMEGEAIIPRSLMDEIRLPTRAATTNPDPRTSRGSSDFEDKP